jgi:peptidylprolyl isomerase
MSKAETGNTVKVHYTGRLNDDTQFDSSAGRDPLEFTLGTGQVIPGFEEAVTGMGLGDSKTVTIPAEQAYGPHHDDLILVVERSQIPAHINPEVGQQLEIHQQDGRAAAVVITEVTDESVSLDANHPLAGQDLIFDLELVEIA